MLLRIKGMGYCRVLFVGNSVGDLDYALRAKVSFFRIRDDSSYARLQALVSNCFPNEPDPWNEAEETIPFYRAKLVKILGGRVAGKIMTSEAITAWINEPG